MSAVQPIRVAAAFGTTRHCAECGNEYTVTSITGRQLYCSTRCRDRVSFRRWYEKPANVAKARAINRAWAAENRNTTRRNAWLEGAPPFPPYLPGGGFQLAIWPPPKWPIELRNTRALHGLVTGLSGITHDEHMPHWSLVPISRGCGWGVYFNDEKISRKLAHQRHDGVLFGSRVTVICGPHHRLKSPRVEKRGHRKLRVDAITPVCIRKDGGTGLTHIYPTAGNMLSTLVAWLPRRVALELGEDALRMQMVERHTQATSVDFGGKYGRVSGWTGWFIVDANAASHWMLKLAEVVGLGGRTAFGLGRIRVTEEP